MAATVLIREWNGTSGSETATDKTSGTIRFKNADNATVDLINPLVKPGAGQVDRSFEKYLRMNISVAAAGNIANPKFYMTGSANTGQTLWIKTTNPGSYSTPAEATADTGYSDAFSFTSGSPKALDVANAGPYTGTGDKGDFLMMMMKVDENVTAPGTLTAKTMTIQWDET
jgi:hypothetical protein